MDGRKLVGIVAALVIVASAGWLFYYSRSQPAPGQPITTLRPVACLKCHAVYAAELGPSPAKCAKCRELALYQATKCANPACGTIIAAYRGVPGARVALVCPKCGQDRFTEVGPNDIPK